MNEYLQLGQFGATGAMLVMVWRLLVAKDKKSYAAAREHTEDIKKINEATQELVSEVTAALVSKNYTDEKMSVALSKLTEQLRHFKEVLKDKQ